MAFILKPRLICNLTSTSAKRRRLGKTATFVAQMFGFPDTVFDKAIDYGFHQAESIEQ
jgi:hypothetical protein